MANDVTFRRIHGRIIPIHKKQGSSLDTKKTAEGAALIGAGTAIAASAGNLAARATQKAQLFKVQSQVYANKATTLFKKIQNGVTKYDKLEKAGQAKFNLKPKVSNPYLKRASDTALKAKGFRSMRKGLRYGGLAVSTALLSTGLKKAYEGTTGKKADAKEEAIATAAAAGATFALSSGYSHRMMGGGAKNLYKAVKYGLRTIKIRVP